MASAYRAEGHLLIKVKFDPFLNPLLFNKTSRFRPPSVHPFGGYEGRERVFKGVISNWTKRLRRRKGEAELIEKRRSLALSRGLLCILSKKVVA